jgi:hypothetical protein
MKTMVHYVVNRLATTACAVGLITPLILPVAVQAFRIDSSGPEPKGPECAEVRSEVDYKAGKKQQTPNAPQDKGAAAYQKELPNLAAPYQRKLDSEMASLKSFAEKFQSDITAAQGKLSFDSTAMKADFHAITGKLDDGRLAQRSVEFQTTYEPQFIRLAQAAGIDLAAQRRQLITLLAFPKKQVKESKTLAIEMENNPPPIVPTPAPPDVTERTLSAPFTSAGTSGASTVGANAATGDLDLFNQLGFAGSVQKVAFISETLSVERGVRRVRVSATLDPVRYYANGLSIGAGYSSAEAIVNLRVMESSHVVASDRVSLARLVTAVAGYGSSEGSRPVTLGCEFTRPIPDDATTYTLIAEIEGWAGAGGFSEASLSETAHLQQFHLFLHRR